jgi:hypothetical protein
MTTDKVLLPVLTDQDVIEDQLITTIDNPYNPFTQFDEWYDFDTLQGYHTCSYLSRLVSVQDEQTDNELSVHINRAVDQIFKENITGMYAKVTRSSFDSWYKEHHAKP